MTCVCCSLFSKAPAASPTAGCRFGRSLYYILTYINICIIFGYISKYLPISTLF